MVVGRERIEGNIPARINKKIKLILFQFLGHKRLPRKRLSKGDEKASEKMAEEQIKIETVIDCIQVKDQLDKDQLHEAFLSAGLEEVNDTVREILRLLTFLYLFLQLIDQIFSQLDEENNGYVTSEKLLGIIKSIQETPSTPSPEPASNSLSPNPPWGVFSNSPTSPPYLAYSTDYSHSSCQQKLEVPLFSQIDPYDTG